MSSRFKHLARGRIAKRGKRNKTEQRYEDTVLAEQKLAGKIVQWWFEPISFRLSSPDSGQPARYTPDFMVQSSDGTMYFDDVKGTGIDNEAAAVRAKTAAEQFPCYVFRICKERRVRDGGGFEVREV